MLEINSNSFLDICFHLISEFVELFRKREAKSFLQIPLCVCNVHTILSKSLCFCLNKILLHLISSIQCGTSTCVPVNLCWKPHYKMFSFLSFTQINCSSNIVIVSYFHGIFKLKYHMYVFKMEGNQNFSWNNACTKCGNVEQSKYYYY